MQKLLFPLVLVLSFTLLGQTPQTPQTGSIEGSVVKFGTTDAIPRAKVILRPTNSPNSQAITADEGGKFTFRDLAPGQYRISVTRDGYVAAEYGQRSPGSSGVPINLNAQQQLKDAKIAMTPTGTISGRIVNRFGEPVGNANVQALRYTYQDGRRTLTPVNTMRTNDLGEYRLFWMQPGQYVVSAQGTDNLLMDPGGTTFVQVSRGAGGPGALAGALVGAQLGVGGVTRITVGPSEPMAGAAPSFGGAGMPPPPPPPPPPPNRGVASDDSNLSLPVYFPGTLDVTAATPVDLRAGGNVGGVNLTLADARPVKIRGQVLNGGRAAAGAQVSLYQRNNPNGTLTVRSAPVNNDTGAFEFRNVAPGGYELVATLNGAGMGAMFVGAPLGNAAGLTAANVAIGGRGGARDPGAPVMGARAQVDVNQTDVEAVSLSLEMGSTVTGRVVIDGQATNTALNLNAIRLQLQSDPLIPPLAIPAVNPEADGTFSVQGVTPGTYRLSVAGLPQNTYVKSARLGGEDVLNGGFKMDRSPNGTLDIVLGNAPGIVEATVVDDRQMPVPAVTVALVPVSAAQEKRYEIYRSATTDSSGKISLQNVVPGEYRIYAWESVENGAWTDPTFMRAFQNSGVAVRVTEGGRASADVRVIPYRVN
jgi:hypothetical protein